MRLRAPAALIPFRLLAGTNVRWSHEREGAAFGAVPVPAGPL